MNLTSLLPRFPFPILALALFSPVMLPLLPAKSKDAGSPMIRIVCIDALAGTDEYILAKQEAEGKWKELQAIKLRSSFLTPWLPTSTGELHLCRREEGKLASMCSFSLPEKTRRALLVLMPKEKDEVGYKPHVLDTSGKNFGKGDVCVINASSMSATVMLGETKIESEPDGSSIGKPALEENGMYRLLVTYEDESENIQTCRDNYLPGNESGRDFLILLPDAQAGLRVVSLTDFGPFE